jgi:hypothetical protein
MRDRDQGSGPCIHGSPGVGRRELNKVLVLAAGVIVAAAFAD